MGNDCCTEIIQKIALSLVRTSSNRINFTILKMLPTNVGEIMKKTGLTKVPVNKRLNELEKYLLIKRYKGTGLVFSGPMTEIFMSTYNELECCIIGDIENQISLKIK